MTFPPCRPQYLREHLPTGCSRSPAEGDPDSALPLVPGKRDGKRGWGRSCPVAEGFPFPLGDRENSLPLLFKALLQPVPPARAHSPAGLVKPLYLLSSGLTGLKFVAR